MPVRKNTYINSWCTDNIIYYVGIDKVMVSTTYGFRELMSEAANSLSFSFADLLNNLTADAKEKKTCTVLDGRLSAGSSYSEKKLSFDNFCVIIVNCQNRQEVYFCAPNVDGEFSSGMPERIAEESPKYPLSVVANDDPMPYKITKSSWKLGYDVYYTGIDRVTVTVNGMTMDLIKAVDSGLLTFDELVADAARLCEKGLIRDEFI